VGAHPSEADPEFVGLCLVDNAITQRERDELAPHDGIGLLADDVDENAIDETANAICHIGLLLFGFGLTCFWWVDCVITKLYHLSSEVDAPLLIATALKKTDAIAVGKATEAIKLVPEPLDLFGLGDNGSVNRVAHSVEF
jgi:hypothetical protein